MNGHNSGWRGVGPHRDFERRPSPPRSIPPEMAAFLRGTIDGRLARIDDLLEVGEIAAARAMIEDWGKELRAGEWPNWLK